MTLGKYVLRFFTWKVPYRGSWYDIDTRFHILGIRVFKYAMIFTYKDNT